MRDIIINHYRFNDMNAAQSASQSNKKREKQKHEDNSKPLGEGAFCSGGVFNNSWVQIQKGMRSFLLICLFGKTHGSSLPRDPKSTPEKAKNEK